MYKLFDWSSVKSAFGGPSWWKLQTLWNWFLSPTLLSLCEFTLLVSIKGLSLPHSFLSKHFIFWKCLFFFFCIRRPCSLTTSEGNGAAEKWLPPWQAWRPLSCISQCYFVNIWGQVNTYQSSCSREDAWHVLLGFWLTWFGLFLVEWSFLILFYV